MTSKSYLQGATTPAVLLGETASGELVPIRVSTSGEKPIFTLAGGTALPVTDSLDAGSGTLTSDATAPSDGDTVVIGSVTYTYKTTLSTGPAVPYEVLIGVSAAVALDNLKSAINGTAGAGTTYGTGTVAHPDVEATTNSNTEQVVVARTAGVIDAIATTETSSHLSWGAATLEGAAGRCALPATGGVLVLKNVGAKACYVALGDASVTATTSSYPIFAGMTEALGLAGTETHLAAVCVSSETTTLSIAVGDGAPVFGVI